MGIFRICFYVFCIIGFSIKFFQGLIVEDNFSWWNFGLMLTFIIMFLIDLAEVKKIKKNKKKD
ncbi:hypothetical protein [Bacillus sp. TL12]|uniref:hypothetical protein n=1 Tax=Bacillus sp. TL12 TaxID=2894756 RepID=UPI001F51BE09|nr:hypothetical protein [Bacillus sp. TL12]MCI0766700.1 hypothetical protein [Bacillus sp. TL12]